MKTIMFIILLCLPLTALAEPSNAVKQLLHEPLSMFEFGLHRLEEKAESISRSFAILRNNSKDERLSATVNYDYDKNKITISAIYYVSESILKTKDPKTLCVDATNDILGWFKFYPHDTFLNWNSKIAIKGFGVGTVWTREIINITFIEIELRNLNDLLGAKTIAHSIRGLGEEATYFRE